MTALLALAGCFGTQDAGVRWVDCDADAIRAEANTHGFSLAFLPCGANRFDDFAWSPDGRHLYFGLPEAAYVMDAAAADKATSPISGVDPSGAAVWLDERRIAFPSAGGADGARIGVYEIDTGRLTWTPLPGLSDPDDLSRDPAGAAVVFLATDASGVRGTHRMDPETGRVGEAFPWLGPVASLTTSEDALVVGRAGGVTVYRASNGESLAKLPGFARGVLHPDGRWLALEREADGRPELSFVDLGDPGGQRWVASGFSGHDFQWYEATGHWGSFVLWGFDEELRRNVVLADLGPRLRAIAEDQAPVDLVATDRAP